MKDETIGKSAPFLFFLTMKKIFLLLFFCIFSLNAIHAEITYTLENVEVILSMAAQNSPLSLSLTPSQKLDIMLSNTALLSHLSLSLTP